MALLTAEPFSPVASSLSQNLSLLHTGIHENQDPQPRRNWKSLPPEILFQIFHSGFPAPPPISLSCRARYAALSELSLVCQSWRGEAQRALWGLLFVGSQEDGEMLLESPALGRYRTMSLTLDASGVSKTGPIKSQEGMVRRIVEGVGTGGGLDHLELSFFDKRREDLRDMFALTCLQTLTSLHIYETHLSSTTTYTCIPPLPCLRNLRLRLLFPSAPPIAPPSPLPNHSSLYSFAMSPSLASLHFQYNDTTFNSRDTHFTALFSAVASQLISLSLVSNGDNLPLPFLPFFSSCVNVRHLALVSSPSQVASIILNFLPPNVRLESVLARHYGWSRNEVDESLDFVPAMTKITDDKRCEILKRLEFRGYCRGILKLDRGRELVERLRVRGTEVVWDGS